MEVAQRSTLDVPHVRDGDDNRIIGIEVFCIELVVEWDNLCTTLVAILLLNLKQILLHNLLTTLWVVENLLQLGNKLLQVVEFLMQLVYTQTCELRQTHINDSLRLELIELEALLQIALGIGRSLRVADDVYHLVDIVNGDDQALEDVCTLLSLAQIVLGAADSYVVTVFNEVLNTLLERKQTWTALDQSNIVYRE